MCACACPVGSVRPDIRRQGNPRVEPHRITASCSSSSACRAKARVDPPTRRSAGARDHRGRVRAEARADRRPSDERARRRGARRLGAGRRHPVGVRRRPASRLRGDRRLGREVGDARRRLEQHSGRRSRSASAGTARWTAPSSSARAHGLTIIGVAAYSPPWARGPSCPPGELHCLPANPDDYGRFMMAAADRYGSRSANPLVRGTVTNWQIWNEPNHQEFSQPKPNLDVYTAMLKSAYAGIKSVDPERDGRHRGDGARARRGRRHGLSARDLVARSVRTGGAGQLRRSRTPPVLVPGEPARRALVERVHPDRDAA